MKTVYFRELESYPKLDIRKLLGKEIFEKLQDEFGLRAKVAAHIVDLVPEDLADMRLIFAKEPSKTDKEDMEKILEMLEQYDVEE